MQSAWSETINSGVPLSGQLGSEEMETLPMPLKGVLRHSPSSSGVGVSESGKLQLGL